MFSGGGNHSTASESLLVGDAVKSKPKGKVAVAPAKEPKSKSSDLRGWPAIAQFLGMPNSTAHRWAKEGMPVRREGRNIVASPKELNQWLQRTSGEAAGVHVIVHGSDLLEDLRASLAAQKDRPQDFSRNPRTDVQSVLRRGRAKRRPRADPN